MKRIFFFILLLVSGITEVFSQNTITPLRNDEQCPGINMTFTVTMTAKSIQSVQPKALNINPTVVQQPFNISVSGANITFNFIGRFTDNNNKQTFQVFYTDVNNSSQNFDFTYSKIKSLAIANPYSNISPQPASIVAQRCQTQNFNISFANVKYGNPFEAPVISYGTVTNYEYLLPANWYLNGILSNGSNWIAGGNNVIVTSDLSTGDGANIRIRASNIACAPGLYPGQESVVAISRPAPSLSITASAIQLCGNQSGTYTINGMPPGATVNWSIVYPVGAPNTNLAQITGPSNQPSVSIQAAASGSGTFYVTATVTHCAFTYTANQFVQAGPPQSIMNRGVYINNGGYQLLTSSINFTNNTDCWISLPAPVVVPYTWTQNMITGNTSFSAPNNTGYNDAGHIQFNKPVSAGASINLSVNSSTACGNLTDRFTIMYNGPSQLMISPDPASTEIAVSFVPPATDAGSTAKAALLNIKDQQTLNTILHPRIMRIKITDATGNVVRQYNYSGMEKVNLDISTLRAGTYTISALNGTQWSSRQLIKK